MKTPDEIQSDYEARLALRQLEAKGGIDADLAAKIERHWRQDRENQVQECINAKIGHETEGDSRFIVSGGKWWQNGPEWLSQGKRAESWTFSAAILAGAAILALAFLAFWAL